MNELNRVERNGMRFYKTPHGKQYPSITTILGITCPDEKKQSLKNWQDSLGSEKAAAITKAAADRGTNVHLMIERYLKKEDVQLNKFSAEDVNSFTALKLKLNQISDIEGQELPLYSDLLEIAGTCDCIASYKGIPSIIDFKTSSKIKSEKDIFDYKLQCTFYGAAYNELYNADINQGVILMTAATGFPLEFTFVLTDYLQELINRVDIFYQQLNN